MAEKEHRSIVPDLPPLARSELNFGGCTMRGGDDGAYRWYAGEIGIGDIFAWEPDLPHARMLVIVTDIIERAGDETVYFTRPFGPNMARIGRRSATDVWNEEGRFREAVVPTTYKPQDI